jgi:hypothetical protein
MSGKTRKAYYSEAEAASTMGISIEELRSLIRRHIVDTEDDLSNCPRATYFPADLVLLKLLSRKAQAATSGC